MLTTRARESDTRDWVALGSARNPAVLVCLPYAGAGAGIFRHWSTCLAGLADVVALRLPGRETRLNEPPLSDAKAVARRIAGSLTEHLRAPSVFYGHSVGALLAYLVARELDEEGVEHPCAVVVGARQAPHLPSRKPAHKLPDTEFIQRVVRYGGASINSAEERELLALYLPTLRKDFAMAERYVHDDGGPLRAPIVSVGGSADPDLGIADLEAWRFHTEGDFRVLRIGGGHLFLHSPQRDLLRVLIALLRDAAGGGRLRLSVLDGVAGR